MTADLIQRLEAATEGNEAFDRAIAKECGVAWSSDEDGQFGGYGILPRRCWFTRSLDAALTLVPEGMGYIIIQSWHRCGGTSASVTYEGGDSIGRHQDPRNGHCTHRRTPIAIAVAALRARASMGEKT